MRDGWTETTLGDVTTHFRGTVKVEDGFPYPAAGVMMEGRGLIDREPFVGGVSGYKKLTPIAPGQLVLRSITAWEAPITVVPVGYVGRHVSGVFPVLNLDESQLNPEFMRLICQWPVFWNEMRMRATGSVLRRKTLSANQLQEIPLNLPPLLVQKWIADVVSSVDVYIDALREQADTARTARNAVLHELLSAGGDDWTETTLGELCELYQPETISKAKMDDAAPYVVYGANGPVGRYSRFNHEEPEVVVTCRGATCGVVNMTPPNCWITGNAMVVKPRDNRSIKGFLFWALQTSVDVRATISGSAQPQITRAGLEPSKILVPPLVEQKRIVEIVSSMDDVIHSAEQAVADAKNLRSGLLSDLLSGEHEIPESYDVFVGAA